MPAGFLMLKWNHIKRNIIEHQSVRLSFSIINPGGFSSEKQIIYHLETYSIIYHLNGWVIYHIKKTCHSAARHSSPMSSFSDFTCRFSRFRFLQSVCLAATPPPARLFSRNSVGVSILLAPDRNADGNDGHTSF